MRGSGVVALILEDEPLIAMDLEFCLIAAGFDVITVASCEKAFELLAVCRPDVVIVDIILRDGPCHEVVKQLLANNIPFLVHSGDHPTMHADTVFSEGTWIGKPFDGVEMIRAAWGLVEA